MALRMRKHADAIIAKGKGEEGGGAKRLRLMAINRFEGAVLAIAGGTVALDFLLPSVVTGMLDELVLLGCVAAMKWARGRS